ncbi:hypothetical protein CDV55_106076 [Aspergillus turcosus]|nr:hypothetical protein CDV55_106076 [Aspergillus turcosus]
MTEMKRSGAPDKEAHHAGAPGAGSWQIGDRPPEGWDDFLAALHKAGLIDFGKAYVISNRDSPVEVERFKAILTNFHEIKAQGWRSWC